MSVRLGEERIQQQEGDQANRSYPGFNQSNGGGANRIEIKQSRFEQEKDP
jgi:hypothetical protein